MILKERLALACSMVDRGSVVADIGTDHGYVPVYLLQNGICNKAFACDIKEGPLKKGQENITFNHLEDKIETRLSDGLQGIKEGEADTFIICGMGADVIIHILSSCPYICNESYTLIIQPMSKYYTLIQWLYENKFEIIKHKCTHEGDRHYTVMKIKYTGKEKSFTTAKTYLGSMDLDDNECREFLKKEISKAEKRALGDKSLVPVIEELRKQLQ